MHESAEDQEVRQQKDSSERFRQGKYRKINSRDSIKIQIPQFYNDRINHRSRSQVLLLFSQEHQSHFGPVL